MQNQDMVLVTESYVSESMKDMDKEGVYVIKQYYDVYI